MLNIAFCLVQLFLTAGPCEEEASRLRQSELLGQFGLIGDGVV